MKTRKKHPMIKSFADQEQRPSRLYLDAVKSMISESGAVLKAHSWLYGHAKKKFVLLEGAFADIEKSLLDAELARPAYVQDKKLNEDYQHARAQARHIKQTMHDLKSGKTLRQFQDDAAKLGAELHQAHQAQLASATKHNADEIFKKLNTARDSNREALAQANRRLDELQTQADEVSCCGPSSKQRHHQELVQRQAAVVNALELTANEPIELTINAAVQVPVGAPAANQEIELLQKRYDSARNSAKFCQEQLASILAAKQKDLDAVRTDVSKAASAINQAALRHFTSLDTKLMHGVIRLSARFDAYKTSFDTAQAEYIKNKDEAAGYAKQLDASKAAVDGLMSQLWCDNFGHLSAKAIYNQYKSLPQQAKDKLLAQQPDTAALAQIMGAATGAKTAAKVSSTGIFKKPVAAETAAKRVHFKRDPHLNFTI